MSEAHATSNHADHEGGHGGGPGRGIGITMAVLGVMLAVCAALVGAERTELLATTITQANAIGVQQAETTKFRVMDADRELLHAVTPSRPEVARFEGALKGVRAKTGKADDEDTSELKDMIDVSTRSIADVLTPDPEDEARIDGLRRTYQRDMAEAKENAEAYDGAIAAHAKAAHGYEQAQLCAEVGIVVASIALLLASRATWALAIAMGLAGLGIGARTRLDSGAALAAAEHRIEEARTRAAPIPEESKDESAGEPTAPAEK